MGGGRGVGGGGGGGAAGKGAGRPRVIGRGRGGGEQRVDEHARGSAMRVETSKRYMLAGDAKMLVAAPAFVWISREGEGAEGERNGTSGSNA